MEPYIDHGLKDDPILVKRGQFGPCVLRCDPHSGCANLKGETDELQELLQIQRII